MKAILKRYSLLLVLFVSLTLNAQDGYPDPKFEKTKSLNKTYPLTAGDKVSLDNRFGDIKLSTWDKNEIKVEINMSAKANTEEVAQELLNRLGIEEGKTGNRIFFKTKITDTKETNRKGQSYNHTKFTTNYIVYLPSQTILEVENEFGKTFVPDYKGEISIQQKFGQLVAGRLDNVKKIHVEFSGGTIIESVNGGELDIRFSRSVINKLSGTVKANFEHSGGIKIVADNSLKQLTVKNAFTSLYLDVATNLSANFKVHTNFSELNNKTNFTIREEEEDNNRRGPKFDHDYSGQSGNGTLPIKINSEFGEVIMGHDIKFDVNAKNEKKAKAKARTI